VLDDRENLGQDKRVPADQIEQRGLVTDLLNAGATGLAAGAGSALGGKLGQGKNPPPDRKGG
jgi:hypothetical protein